MVHILLQATRPRQLLLRQMLLLTDFDGIIQSLRIEFVENRYILASMGQLLRVPVVRCSGGRTR